MQIVIDIPEKTYKQLGFLNEQGFGTIIDEAVANGIPLPKGHGKLIDADALWDAYHDNDYDFYEALDDAETVIEADTESEE